MDEMISSHRRHETVIVTVGPANGSRDKTCRRSSTRDRSIGRFSSTDLDEIAVLTGYVLDGDEVREARQLTDERCRCQRNREQLGRRAIAAKPRHRSVATSRVVNEREQSSQANSRSTLLPTKISRPM
jgi:hypothetical protein